MHIQTLPTFAPATSAPTNAPICATLVPPAKRMGFLPRLFGKHLMIRGEHLVYEWMGALCPAYHGGYWEFYDVSNGGGFMALRAPLAVQIRVEGNHFDEEVSPVASGLIATTFALNSLLWKGHEELFDRYDQLQAYIALLPEAAVIRRAID